MFVSLWGSIQIFSIYTWPNCGSIFSVNAIFLILFMGYIFYSGDNISWEIINLDVVIAAWYMESHSSILVLTGRTVVFSESESYTFGKTGYVFRQYSISRTKEKITILSHLGRNNFYTQYTHSVKQTKFYIKHWKYNILRIILWKFFIGDNLYKIKKLGEITFFEIKNPS